MEHTITVQNEDPSTNSFALLWNKGCVAAMLMIPLYPRFSGIKLIKGSFILKILDESDFNESVVLFKVLGFEDRDKTTWMLCLRHRNVTLIQRPSRLIRKESVAVFKKYSIKRCSSIKWTYCASLRKRKSQLNCEAGCFYTAFNHPRISNQS